MAYLILKRPLIFSPCVFWCPLTHLTYKPDTFQRTETLVKQIAAVQCCELTPTCRRKTLPPSFGSKLTVNDKGVKCAFYIRTFKTIGYVWVHWDLWNMTDLKSQFLIIEDESKKSHRNVGIILQISTVVMPRRLTS